MHRERTTLRWARITHIRRHGTEQHFAAHLQHATQIEIDAPSTQDAQRL